MPIPTSPWLERRIDAMLLPATPATRWPQARAETRRAQLATPAPPPAPAGAGPASSAAMPSRTHRRHTEKAATERERERERERVREPDAGDDLPAWRGACLPVAARGEREQGQHPHGEQPGNGLAAAPAANPGTGEELDAALIAALLAQPLDSGMFEVLLPGGDSLGVALDVRAGALDYLLTPGSHAMAGQLRGRQMELAAHLQQRIGRSVTVTVL